MRLLFLSKRYPQQRDLLTRPYGRFFHLPVVLAARGHDVRAALISHHGHADLEVTRNGVVWTNGDLCRKGPLGLLGGLHSVASSFRPDWVIGCSDAWVGYFAWRVARRAGSRLALDAYDDFESYMPWNLPLHWQYRRALGAADLVTAAGPQLADLLDRVRSGRQGTAVLPMAADPSFYPRNRAECRGALGLPPNAPVLGYYGGWGARRGTDVLIAAFRLIRQVRPDAILALTGRPPREVLAEPGVISLGYLEDSLLPLFVNCLDVSCVVTADTQFGRSSYPAKLCEAMACGIPVVASATEPVRWMLSRRPDRLVAIGDPAAFSASALAALSLDRINYGALRDWTQLGAELDQLLTAASADQTSVSPQRNER